MPLPREKYNEIKACAYNFLCKFEINKLPLDLFYILDRAEIKLVANKDVKELKNDECGLGIFDGSRWHIVYDSKMSLERIRFTIAHELGHIALRHMEKAGKNKNKENTKRAEQEADFFASCLLAPPCILKELNAYSANSIRLMCKTSSPSAKIQSKAMIRAFLNKETEASQIERKLIKNFKDFIKTHKLQSLLKDEDKTLSYQSLYNKVNKSVRQRPKLDID